MIENVNRGNQKSYYSFRLLLSIILCQKKSRIFVYQIQNTCINSPTLVLPLMFSISLIFTPSKQKKSSKSKGSLRSITAVSLYFPINQPCSLDQIRFCIALVFYFPDLEHIFLLQFLALLSVESPPFRCSDTTLRTSRAASGSLVPGPNMALAPALNKKS